MARYSTAEALRLIMEEDTEVDEDSVVKMEIICLKLVLPLITKIIVSEEFDESEDVSASDEEHL